MSLIHLHLILNHVPVIGLGFVIVILLIALWRNNSDTAKLGLTFAVGLAAVAALVFVTGEPAEEAIEGVVGVSESAIHSHEEAAEAALIAVGLAGAVSLLALALYWHRSLPRWVISTALVVTFGASGVMGWAANLGGQIRHTEIGSSVRPAGETERDER